MIAKQEEKKEMEEKAAAKKLSAVNNLIQTGHKVWLDEKESEENIADIERNKHTTFIGIRNRNNISSAKPA